MTFIRKPKDRFEGGAVCCRTGTVLGGERVKGAAFCADRIRPYGDLRARCRDRDRWYAKVLGLRVLSPPYRMSGEAIERDMGELVPSPVVVKAAIVGLATDDRVLELIEYPEAGFGGSQADDTVITRPGLTHVGLVCDDIDTTRQELEARGVVFLTRGVADVAGLRTTWFHDPWGTVFILLEKRNPALPYWDQYQASVS